MYRVYITGDFDSETEARMALSDMEEVIGKHDGDMIQEGIEDTDTMEEI